jgi:hypothetical protein
MAVEVAEASHVHHAVIERATQRFRTHIPIVVSSRAVGLSVTRSPGVRGRLSSET